MGDLFIQHSLILSVGPMNTTQGCQGVRRGHPQQRRSDIHLPVHLPFTIPIFLMRATNVVGLIPSRSAAPPFP